MNQFGQWLIATGVLALGLGLLWPWISKWGLGRLPGDIVIERDDMKIYLPLTTAILISVGLTVIVWVFFKQ